MNDAHGRSNAAAIATHWPRAAVEIALPGAARLPPRRLTGKRPGLRCRMHFQGSDIIHRRFPDPVLRRRSHGTTTGIPVLA